MNTLKVPIIRLPVLIQLPEKISPGLLVMNSLVSQWSIELMKGRCWKSERMSRILSLETKFPSIHSCTMELAHDVKPVIPIFVRILDSMAFPAGAVD